MKLKSLLFATMFACVFASCSKDDDTINPQPELKGDAELTIAIKGATTKAIAGSGDFVTTGSVQLKGEANINTLVLAVYDGNGEFVKSASSAANDAKAGKISIKGLPVGTPLQFVVFANMPTEVVYAEKTLDELKGQDLLIPATDGFLKNSLPMSSDVQSITKLVSGNNYYGYASAEGGVIVDGKTTPVELIRNVARVDLKAVKLGVSKTSYSEGEASFQYTGVFINGVVSSVNFDNTSITDAAVWDGYSLVTGAVQKGFFKNMVSGGDKAIATQYIAQEETKVVEAEHAYFYVLQNLDENKPTTLVMAGKFGLKNAKNVNGNIENAAPSLGYYPVKVGIDGTISGTTVKGVTHNDVYEITITVAGAGKATPDGDDKAQLFVKCEVKDWNKVDQDHTIE